MEPSSRLRLVAVVTAVTFGTACTSTKEVRRADLGREFGATFQEVIGFTTVDGVHQEFEGAVRSSVASWCSTREPLQGNTARPRRSIDC